MTYVAHIIFLLDCDGLDKLFYLKDEKIETWRSEGKLAQFINGRAKAETQAFSYLTQFFLV